MKKHIMIRRHGNLVPGQKVELTEKQAELFSANGYSEEIIHKAECEECDDKKPCSECEEMAKAKKNTAAIEETPVEETPVEETPIEETVPEKEIAPKVSKSKNKAKAKK